MKINIFSIILSLVWYIASILIIYGGIKYSFKYKFLQFKIKNIILSIKSKSKNNISPLSSLCISLAAKIGVGSISGIALAIYYGGIGTIFWIIIISLIVSINTYIECILGIKYRKRIANNIYIGGPSYYIKECLGNKYLSYLYSILVIISYSVFFLSIQTNTITSTLNHFNINKDYAVVVLFIITFITIIKGIKRISVISSYIVPIMLIIYLSLGIYVFITNITSIPGIMLKAIKEAFNYKSIISVFLIGMQRAIFITESSLGTSAIAASSCDNEPHSQASLEVLGIYITIFLVCLSTFIIISTSNYHNLNNINGIELILYSFKEHFGSNGSLILSIIIILFAFSTIISSYYFGESNLIIFSKNKVVKVIYKTLFMSIIIISCYMKAHILWNLTDFFVGLLAIINMYSIIKIHKY